MSHFGPENDGSLAYRLEDYLLSGSFLAQLNDFVASHAPKFDDVQDWEHRHEWHDSFLEYEDMLHHRVEAFLRAEGVTAEQAVQACKVARAAGNKDYRFFEYLAAAIDYQKFHAVMLEFKSGKRDVSKWWKCFAQTH
mmetsp:Transcript_108753/g.314017  ORF Transcript_108753/g.314017 Transcript_108753/m.314017 type:complete len:137 (+) Transcript_108753:95-505(+)